MTSESEKPTQADTENMLMGVQPLDAVLEARGINNHEVVAAAGRGSTRRPKFDLY